MLTFRLFLPLKTNSFNIILLSRMLCSTANEIGIAFFINFLQNLWKGK